MVAPSDVKMMADVLENSTYEFLSYLVYSANEGELDRQFLDLHNELFIGYDCVSCRNCCKEFATALSEDEVDSILTLIRISKDEFVAEYAI